MNRIIMHGVLALTVAFLLTPVAALGANSWTAVTVNQTQDAWSPNHQVDLTQNASITASTNIGNQAVLGATSTGNQQLWVTGRGHQAQDLSVGTRLQWTDNTWPAAAVGTTHASLDQTQQGWSNHPMHFKQDGGIWLRNNVGGTVSNADAQLNQTSHGAVGDFTQSQAVAGQNRAEGFIDPPFPSCSHNCTTSFGGRLIQRVNVVVENLFNF